MWLALGTQLLLIGVWGGVVTRRQGFGNGAGAPAVCTLALGLLGQRVVTMRARVRMSDTNTAILRGELDLTAWSEEELIRGQRRARNGHFQGRPPRVVPWRHVDVGYLDECWPIHLKANKDGYVRFRMDDGSMMPAGHFAWETMNGPVPEGMQVSRTCGNRRCVNPWHLKLTTPASRGAEVRDVTHWKTTF